MSDYTEKIYIGQLLMDAVHRPSIMFRGKMAPLYRRVEGYGSDDPEYLNDIEWQRACKLRYSSPNAIRRIIIGNNSVMIYRYDREAIITKLRPSIDMPYEQYSGTATLFLKRFAISNLEELYFDTGFLNALLAMSPNSQGIRDVNSFLASCGGNISYGMQVINEIVTREMMTVEGLEGKRLVDRYKRIRAIGFVSNLDALIEQCKGETTQAQNRADYEKVWSGLMSKPKAIILMGKQLESNWCKLDLPDGTSHTFCEDYTIRDGIYYYDQHVLNQWKQAEDERVASYRRKMNVRKSEFETVLDSSSEPEKVLKVMITSYGAAGVAEMIAKMSPMGNTKYSELLNRIQ